MATHKNTLMKQFSFLLLLTLFLSSCVGDDIIADRVDEKLAINNPIEQLTLNRTYQYTTKYTDNVGQVKTPQVTWTSSQPGIISVSNTGLITALTIGQATVTASVTTAGGETITTEDMVMTTNQNIDNNGPREKKGTIRTTSSYALRGDFTIKEIPNTNDLELSISANYMASSSLPGLYLYLTNNPNTVNNAKEIAKVAVFNGAHKYTIKNTGINDFSHLLYWCKPFSVKVGDGEIK